MIDNPDPPPAVHQQEEGRPKAGETTFAPLTISSDEGLFHFTVKREPLDGWANIGIDHWAEALQDSTPPAPTDPPEPATETTAVKPLTVTSDEGLFTFTVKRDPVNDWTNVGADRWADAGQDSTPPAPTEPPEAATETTAIKPLAATTDEGLFTFTAKRNPLNDWTNAGVDRWADAGQDSTPPAPTDPPEPATETTAIKPLTATTDAGLFAFNVNQIPLDRWTNIGIDRWADARQDSTPPAPTDPPEPATETTAIKPLTATTDEGLFNFTEKRNPLEDWTSIGIDRWADTLQDSTPTEPTEQQEEER
ncbi:hypothetical protein [Nocardia sp. NPDC052566]|uniref:hypothetical protein n=1 Tax=Nocardia sp. NPDC052566 TaxID=3364330 RepID=UPI0037C54157